MTADEWSTFRDAVAARRQRRFAREAELLSTLYDVRVDHPYVYDRLAALAVDGGSTEEAVSICRAFLSEINAPKGRRAIERRLRSLSG